MASNIIDLHIEKGSEFVYTFKVSVDNATADLDAYNFRSKILNDGNLVSFTVTEDINDGITLSLTNIQTSALQRGVGTYDVEMINTGFGTVTRILKGRVFIDEEVTV